MARGYKVAERWLDPTEKEGIEMVNGRSLGVSLKHGPVSGRWHVGISAKEKMARSFQRRP